MQQEVVPTPTPGQRRGPGHGDGGGRQLQRHLGGAGPAGLGVRRAQGGVPRRRLGCRRHRLGGRQPRAPLAGRRRGGGPLQSGRRRRRGVQRRRPDVLADPADLGLRDARWLVRPVLPGAVAPADAAPQAPDLGRERLLCLNTRDRLSHVVRPCAAHAEARPERVGLGRRRGSRLDGDPDHRRVRRQRDCRDLRRGQARVRRKSRGQRRDQSHALRLLGPAARRRRRRSVTRRT